jgi:hypothetical protein
VLGSLRSADLRSLTQAENGSEQNCSEQNYDLGWGMALAAYRDCENLDFWGLALELIDLKLPNP